MTDIKNTVSDVAHSPAVVNLIRVGYGVRGYLFFVLGLLSLQLALGRTSQTPGTQGAIALTAAQPFGKFLLIIMLIGLIFYVFWMLACSIFNVLRLPHDGKGTLKRVGFFFNALLYALLIPTILSYVTGKSSASGGQSVQIQHLATTIFRWPGGKWLIALIGLALLIGGAAYAYSGTRRDFDKEARSYSLTPTQVMWIKRLGRIGTVAVGAVVAVIGILFLLAFRQADPMKATGIDGALLALVRLPFGKVLLALIGLGLMAYGVFLALSALWLRPHLPRRV